MSTPLPRPWEARKGGKGTNKGGKSKKFEGNCFWYGAYGHMMEDCQKKALGKPQVPKSPRGPDPKLNGKGKGGKKGPSSLDEWLDGQEAQPSDERSHRGGCRSVRWCCQPTREVQSTRVASLGKTQKQARDQCKSYKSGKLVFQCQVSKPSVLYLKIERVCVDQIHSNCWGSSSRNRPNLCQFVSLVLLSSGSLWMRLSSPRLQVVSCIPRCVPVQTSATQSCELFLVVAVIRFGRSRFNFWQVWDDQHWLRQICRSVAWVRLPGRSTDILQQSVVVSLLICDSHSRP